MRPDAEATVLTAGLGAQLRKASLLRAGGAPLKALQPDNVAQSSNTRHRTGPPDPVAARGGSTVLRKRAPGLLPFK